MSSWLAQTLTWGQIRATHILCFGFESLTIMVHVVPLHPPNKTAAYLAALRELSEGPDYPRGGISFI